MSKFTESMATMHTMSIAAMEEASRNGQRTTDIEHLLLAMTLNDQVAGQVLRSLGITFENARHAVETQHADQLASLGISAIEPTLGPIVLQETGGYEWSEQALTLFRHASEGKKRGDASALLRELIIEPSGLIEAILHRLGVTPIMVLSRLDTAERELTTPRTPHMDARGLSGKSEIFVPASIGSVWQLLSDPLRMPEWEPGIGSVEHTDGSAEVGDCWNAQAPTQRSGGKRLKIKPEFRTLNVNLIESNYERLIAWRVTYPQAPAANARLIRIEMDTAAGGTQLRISYTWERSTPRRPFPVLGFVLGPLHRWAIWMQLSTLGAGISRALR